MRQFRVEGYVIERLENGGRERHVVRTTVMACDWREAMAAVTAGMSVVESDLTAEPRR